MVMVILLFLLPEGITSPEDMEAGAVMVVFPPVLVLVPDVVLDSDAMYPE